MTPRMEGHGLTPLTGGFSGETFLAESEGHRIVVRIYAGRGARRERAAEIDAAVLHLVRGLLPVPRVLEVRRPDAAVGTPGVLITSFVPGERLDISLPGLGDRQRAAVARELGLVLGRLVQMPMPRRGEFVDAGLRIEPWADGTDLPAWVRRQRSVSAIADWPDDLYEGLRAVAGHAQGLLDEIDRACLVHSDFNPKNLLVDPAAGELTGLLDWEFAHAGTPMTDLGNLLRFERDPGFTGGVLDGYLSVAGHLDGLGRLTRAARRKRLLELARAADLFALAELAGRRGQNPVADRADALLRAVAASGDLHAAA